MEQLYGANKMLRNSVDCCGVHVETICYRSDNNPFVEKKKEHMWKRGKDKDKDKDYCQFKFVLSSQI